MQPKPLIAPILGTLWSYPPKWASGLLPKILRHALQTYAHPTRSHKLVPRWALRSNVQMIVLPLASEMPTTVSIGGYCFPQLSFKPAGEAGCFNVHSPLPQCGSQIDTWCFHMLSILSWLDTCCTVYIPMILPVLDGLMKQGSARGQPRLGTDFRVRTDLWYPVCLFRVSRL